MFLGSSCCNIAENSTFARPLDFACRLNPSFHAFAEACATETLGAYVHEEALHRAMPAARDTEKIFPAESVGERFHAEAVKLRRAAARLRQAAEFAHAESAGALEPERAPVIEHEKQMFMLAFRHIGRFDADHTGHAEVHQKRAAVIELRDHVAGAAADVDEPPSRQLRVEQRSERFPHGG